MILRLSILILFTFVGLIPSTTVAQTLQDSLTLRAFQEAHKSIVLLKNENQLLPLHRLDTQRIAFIPFGLSPKQEDILLQQMHKYTPRVLLTSPEVLQLRPDLFNLVVMAVAEDMVGNSAISELYSKTVPLVTLLIGPDNAFLETDLLQSSEAFLYVQEVNDLSLSIVAQIPFGGQAAIGRLFTPLGMEESPFIRGYGLQTGPPCRLGYVPPAVMGMDARLLYDSIAFIVEQGIDKGAFPGAQVLVAKDGQIVYHEAFGFHTYDNDQAVQLEDLYDFASLTKVTSGLPALMKWYGDGRFDLDETLGDYFPYFKDTDKANLSFRSILSHQSRLRPWIPYWQGTIKDNARYPWEEDWNSNTVNNGQFRKHTFKQDSSKNYPIRVTDQLWLHKDFKYQIYENILESPLNELEEYRYSGLFFYLLPDLVYHFSGQQMENYLKTMFYRPLGAFTITYNPLHYFPKDRIIPTERDTFFRKVQLHGMVHDEGAAMMAGISCNAGLFGSANDLAKLMQLYMNKGRYGRERYIDSAAVDTFITRHYAASGNRRGLGFDKPLLEYDAKASTVAKSVSDSSFGHSGYTGTFAWADPERGLLYIFFSNRVFPTRNNRKIYELNIRPRIHQVLYDACYSLEKD